MSLTCKLTQAEEYLLIHLCEEKLSSVIEKMDLSLAEREEQRLVFEVYNKLVLGADLPTAKTVDKDVNTPEKQLRALMIRFIDQLQEVEVAGTLQVYIGSPQEISISVSSASNPRDDTNTYEIGLYINEGEIEVYAHMEQVSLEDLDYFLENQLEEDLEEELS